MSTNTIQPASLAIYVPTSGGPYLYAGDNDNAPGNNGNVAAFNPTAGVLSATELAGSPYAGGNTPLSIAVDETQKFVFAPNVYDGTIHLGLFDRRGRRAGERDRVAVRPYGADCTLRCGCQSDGTVLLCHGPEHHAGNRNAVLV
jgi:DNA-binding beta-propeller fold protein YncE